MVERQGYRLLVVYEDVDAHEPTSYNLLLCQRSSGVEQRFRNSKPKKPDGHFTYEIEQLCE